ncbi:PIG-L family deacetylase [Curtobacterium sp. 9128]|uniref:PIG-L family deacetylase n=1 Tax=Curtobacterium sp. 9128 TaxID=1793722 RepID=UPI0016426BC3|nr:PIG-L family deacetylase [Curtobacterium sp. 9128]
MRNATTALRTPWRRVLAVLLLVVAMTAALIAVGTGPARAATTCAAGSQITVIAHPDDDLFFMNPDILGKVSAAGWCTTTVYVTSGDAGLGSSYSTARESGIKAAYAKMTGTANRWTSARQTAGGHSVLRATLKALPRVQLVFLRLPDGNIDGTGFGATGSESMEQLMTGWISTMTTVDSSPQTYTEQGIVDTIGALLTKAAPTVIRTQDSVHAFGSDDDHSDHHAVGQLTLRARDAVAPTVPITPYLGYPTVQLPTNVSGADLAAKSAAYYTYAPYDSQICQTASACAGKPEEQWLPRQHPVADLTPPSGGGSGPGAADGNAAAAAVVTASSQNTADGQGAVKATDGVVDGYPGNASAEWASQGGGVGTRLQLTWMEPVAIDRVVLFDRPNSDDQITAGTLTFSDGSTVPVPTLANDGSATEVDFTARSITSLRLTVTGTSATTRNIGLAELQAWTPGSGTTTPPSTTPDTDLARSATADASSASSATGQTADKAIDGVVDGYPGVASAEWATDGGGVGSTLRLTWGSPVTVGRVVLYDRPNSDDQVTSATLTFPDGSSVPVGTLDNAGGATTVSFPPRSVSSLTVTVTGVSGTTKNVGLAELEAFGS